MGIERFVICYFLVVEILNLLLALWLAFFPFRALAQGQGPSAGQVLSRAESNFLKLATLQGTAQKAISQGKRRVNLAYKFYYQKPDKFRIELLRPLKKQVISNGQIYWEYIPSSKRVIKKELRALSDEEKRKLGVTLGFGLDLLAKVPATRYEYRLESREGGNYLVTATPKEGEASLTQKEILVESKRWLVLTFKHYSAEGKLIAQADFADYHPFKGGIWFPMKITTRVLPENYLEGIFFAEVKVNEPLSESLFTFKIPPGTQPAP